MNVELMAIIGDKVFAMYTIMIIILKYSPINASNVIFVTIGYVLGLYLQLFLTVTM